MAPPPFDHLSGYGEPREDGEARLSQTSLHQQLYSHIGTYSGLRVSRRVIQRSGLVHLHGSLEGEACAVRSVAFPTPRLVVTTAKRFA